MCRISCNAVVSDAQSEVAAATGTVLTVDPRQHTKSTFRFRPFRKVAKSARINLNRYWGLLSQTSSMKPSQDPVPVDHSYEEEQNRINEMLEAQNAAAISDNARNFCYENSPEFYRRHSQSPSLSSVTSSSQSTYYDSSEDVMSIVSGGSLV